MKPEKIDGKRIRLTSEVLYRQARVARAKYIGELLASACDATVRGIKAGQVSVAICLLFIVSGIAVIAI